MYLFLKKRIPKSLNRVGDIKKYKKMKKKYFFKTFIALFITVNVMAQNVPNYVPTNGLVGWWPFNGNANDESGNENHGTVNGATLTADRNGTANSAYSFDGTNSINFKEYTLLQQINSDITISCWANPNESLNQTLIWFGDSQSAHDPYAIQVSADNKYFFRKDVSNGLTTEVVSSSNYAVKKVTHIVAVYNSTTKKMSIYIDGVLDSEIIMDLTINYSLQSMYLTFGAIENGNFGLYTGILDDISIYNRALTQEEITVLYTSTPICTNPSATITPQGNTSFCQGGFVNLNASTGANYTYEWYNNGQLINGATASVYQASTSGNYTVKVIDGACNATSTATTVMVNPNPTATITPQGNTTFCQGGFVNLVASGGTSYQWNTGSSVATISATQSGTYTVNVFNSFGCQATASQQVIVNPLPNVTLNALNQFTLKNASPIQLVASPVGGTFNGDGVQGSTFNPANGSLGKKTITYNYTSPEGCSGQALINTIIADTLGNVCSTYDTLKVKFKLTTGIKANQYTTMNVYPNPTSDVIVIEASDVAALNGYSYKLFDVQGKEVYNALVTNAKTEISMKTFGKAGVYILHVVDANNVSIETKQIVLE